MELVPARRFMPLVDKIIYLIQSNFACETEIMKSSHARHQLFSRVRPA